MKRKTLQELTLKDNFMFAAVMLDPENCKGILERALDFPYSDGSHTLFLSTNGTNDDEVSKELVSFLRYVKSGENSQTDTFVEQLSQAVSRIKSDRDMGARFMLLEEMLKDEHKAGRMETLLRLISVKGFESSMLREAIRTITDTNTLDELTDAILTANSRQLLDY